MWKRTCALTCSLSFYSLSHEMLQLVTCLGVTPKGGIPTLDAHHCQTHGINAGSEVVQLLTKMKSRNGLERLPLQSANGSARRRG